MVVAAEELVPLPLDGADHYHTGCFHVECPLPNGLALWLIGGLPYPKFASGLLAVRLGQRLGAWVRPAGAATGYDQGELERSGALDGLAITWSDAEWAGGRLFEFRAEPRLLAELSERVRAFASRAAG